MSKVPVSSNIGLSARQYYCQSTEAFLCDSLHWVCINCTTPTCGFRCTFGCWMTKRTFRGRSTWEPQELWQIFPPGSKTSWTGMAFLSPSDLPKSTSPHFTTDYSSPWLTCQTSPPPTFTACIPAGLLSLCCTVRRRLKLVCPALQWGAFCSTVFYWQYKPLVSHKHS